MQTTEPVKPPSRKERITLRLMIFIGMGSMAAFLYGMLQPQQIGYAPFYWTLIIAIFYACLRIIHEWYHYFSITIPETPAHTQPFTVDIFTTFYPGEPYPMVVETLKAIQQITYPHTTYLCDEANDPYLKQVCKELGVRHIIRNDRKDAKAGNINNALKHANGDLCVILDPDHVPAPDLLDPIVGHFNDPTVGFVQIVQAYKNIHESLIAKGAAQQTFQFYGPIMMTMHQYGTVQAIGANCTFRRTSLDSIGGHAAGLSEDMHTAMRLHAKGWKSIYVPAILTRGLVPSSLPAYYKQQLKWSRGTFELLVTTYPKLFKHFSWRQRIHYGTLPFHFFCGVIFFINFLIPILSLVMGVIPFRIDLVTFFLLGLPLLTSTILIRHYVQWWVMEENERGFHVIGGLLLIGTWWIYILGLFYTLIRKKVPYVPTPKGDKTSPSWKLNFPNIVIGILSLGTIVYGLSYDWNPYTFVMAGIAALNCFFMGFVILASYQHEIDSFLSQFRMFRNMGYILKNMKGRFWVGRHYLYSGVRRSALPLILIFVGCSAFFLIRITRIQVPEIHQISEKSKEHLYTGIFFPATSNGLTALHQVAAYQQQYSTHFNIISLYIPWGDEERCNIPKPLIDSIYQLGALPMITWEPWASLFDMAQNNEELRQEQKIFYHIRQGLFDNYLKEFALQIKAFNRPLYLRFAHEFDNPSYPWSGRGNNTPADFIRAWQYVHDYFTQLGVFNAIWVWNPWTPEAIDAYFPGEAYVDWMGVDILNYGSFNTDKTWYSFAELYQPFHEKKLFQSGIPVMVAEMSSLKTEKRQDIWLKEAFHAMDTLFHEIKAMVFFNSDQDINVPQSNENDTLDWTLADPQLTFTALKNDLHHDNTQSTIEELSIVSTSNDPIPQPPIRFDTIKGINFTKGQHWFKNYHTLTKRELNRDFYQLKSLGINTIKRYGPTIYVRNILSVAAAHDIKIHYSFWVPETLNFINDEPSTSALAEKILKTIENLKDKEIITAWNIGNDIAEQLQHQYYKPALLYHQKAYIVWLKNLVKQIKSIDPKRPVTLDVIVTHHLLKDIQFLHAELPEIDAFGLIVYDDKGMDQIEKLQVPYFYSYIDANQYLHLQEKSVGTFITDWQDTKTKTEVSFDGVIDHWGRHKQDYHLLARQWGNKSSQSNLPSVKILRPALPTLPGTLLKYHALVYSNDQWVLADSLPHNMQFEWHLIKNDAQGNSRFMTEIGQGTHLSFEIPEDPFTYTLYLVASKGNDVITDQSVLHTLLYSKQ